MWLILFLLLAPLTPQIDLEVARFCYSPETGFYNNAFFQFLYQYGELFGFAAGGAVGILFVFTFFFSKLKGLRAASCAMLLTFLVGVGGIAHEGFKEYWGRPRPSQVIEFGGNLPYKPFWKPNWHARDQKSFPSGHVIMGFYFLSLYFVAKRAHLKNLSRAALLFSCLLGGILMITRIAQGGHFVTDALFSFLLMWTISKASVYFTWEVCAKQPLLAKLVGTFQEFDPL